MKSAVHYLTEPRVVRLEFAVADEESRTLSNTFKISPEPGKPAMKDG